MHVDECSECIIKCIILPDRMHVVNKIYLHQSLNVSSFQAECEVSKNAKAFF